MISANSYIVSLNVGDKSNLIYSVELALRIGEENVNFSESLLKFFEKLDDNTIQLVIRYQCYNPEAVKEKFEELFEGLIEVGLNMLPPQIYEYFMLFRNDLKIEYAMPPEELLIRIYLDNQIIDQLFLVYRQLSGMFIQEDTSILARLKIQTVEKLGGSDADLLNKFGRGLQADFDVTTSSYLVEYARQIYSTLLEKYHGTQKMKLLEHLTPFTMINNARLKFHFETFQDFVEELASPFLYHFQSQMMINAVKKKTDNDYAERIEQLPFANSLTELLKSEKRGPIDFSLISKEASITLTDASKVV